VALALPRSAKLLYPAPARHPVPIIQLHNVKKRFGAQVVLDGVSLDIHAGETVVVMGGSGSGKSVMLKHIVGLLRPDAGEVWFDGKRVDHMREPELVEMRKRFGFLFQMGALFDSLTCAENVAFPLVEHTSRTPAEIAKTTLDKLSMIGLPEVGAKMPAQLSGGQRKRVALARAIALNPEVILYDEPTTGLDPIRSDVINELILKLASELKVTSVVVTHDMISAFKVATRMVMLYQGKLVFNGTPDEARASKDEHLRRFIAGEATEEELAGLDGAGGVRMTG
jgi:phospholipid/cholesterol/gamma-HCH transport system ATP-binding protein